MNNLEKSLLAIIVMLALNVGLVIGVLGILSHFTHSTDNQVPWCPEIHVSLEEPPGVPLNEG